MFAGTEYQSVAPNPTPVPAVVGQDQVPGQVPLIREGAPVKALAFTGRGLTMVRSVIIETKAGTGQRLLAGVVPFVGLVRSFAFGSNAQGSVYMGVAYGERTDVADYTTIDMGGDTLCYKALGNLVPSRLIMGNYAVGAWWNAPLNFLLPRAGLALKFHYYNNTGGDVTFASHVEVLEVIPELG